MCLSLNFHLNCLHRIYLSHVLTIVCVLYYSIWYGMVGLHKPVGGISA